MWLNWQLVIIDISGLFILTEQGKHQSPPPQKNMGISIILLLEINYMYYLYRFKNRITKFSKRFYYTIQN